MHYIYYHIFLFSDWKIIVVDQLECLKNSGLLENCVVRVGIVFEKNSAHEIEEIKNLLSNYDNIEILFIRHTSPCGECDTLFELDKFAKTAEQDLKILYIHSKGVTQLYTERHEFVWSWRKLMEYFLVLNWKECITKLDEGYDCCGINYQDHAGVVKNERKLIKIFNGNFFWVKTSYLKKLDISIVNYDRYSAENWILSSEHKAYSFFNPPSGFDFYHNKITNFEIT
jgi:DUF971 family protein